MLRSCNSRRCDFFFARWSLWCVLRVVWDSFYGATCGQIRGLSLESDHSHFSSFGLICLRSPIGGLIKEVYIDKRRKTGFRVNFKKLSREMSRFLCRISRKYKHSFLSLSRREHWSRDFCVCVVLWKITQNLFAYMKWFRFAHNDFPHNKWQCKHKKKQIIGLVLYW